MTKQEQRAEILSYIAKRAEVAKTKPEITLHGYFPLAGLQEKIYKVMGYEVTLGSWRGESRYYENPKGQMIIDRMEAQGYIKLSKSGKAYKVLKTK